MPHEYAPGASGPGAVRSSVSPNTQGLNAPRPKPRTERIDSATPMVSRGTTSVSTVENTAESLEQQMTAFHAGRDPDYELLRDVVYYLHHYADRYHHPRETVEAAAATYLLYYRHHLAVEEGEILPRVCLRPNLAGYFQETAASRIIHHLSPVIRQACHASPVPPRAR